MIKQPILMFSGRLPGSPRITKTILVWHDAEVSPRSSPRQVICDVSPNDWHECKWCYMHLLNVGVHQFACTSIQCYTNYNIWPTTVVESSQHYRCRTCSKQVTSYVQPQSLPPTSDAAKYHSLRVYCQIQQWKGSGVAISPTEWGCSESNGGLVPVQTNLPPAPQELLRVIRCNCKSDCSGPRCTCKKHDVECSPACGNCRGSGCSNSNRLLLDEDDENNAMYMWLDCE
jgi:hypothetical protein